MFALRERRMHITQEDFEMAVGKVMKKVRSHLHVCSFSPRRRPFQKGRKVALTWQHSCV